MVARWAHYSEVAGSSPAPATTTIPKVPRKARLSVSNESPGDILSGLSRENMVLSFTGGQFSMLDWVEAMMARVGPCDLTLCSWTASKAAALRIGSWLREGKAGSIKMIIDDSLASRQPRAHEALEDQVGAENLVEMSVHAKFAIAKGKGETLTALMSGNLTSTPAAEYYLVESGPGLYEGVKELVDKVWGCDLEAGRVWGQLRSKEAAQAMGGVSVFEMQLR